MKWRFFFGASLLTAATLLPHAGTTPVVVGVILAGIVQWGASRIGRGQT